jgi:hypothetical protein
MALITSAATGNFSAGATWTGGVVPTVGDEARASTGHTITIDVDTTCDEVSNAGTGIFTLASGVTLTANVTNKSATTSRNCLQFTAASPAQGFIVGNCTGGPSNDTIAVANTSSGSVTITGNVTGVTARAYGVNNASTGSVTVTGNVTGGSGTVNPFGINNASTGSVTVTGNVTGGSSASGHGIGASSTGVINIIGNVSASTGGNGIFSTTAFTLNATGDITATNSASGINSSNVSATLKISGSFISALNGTVPIYAPKFILDTTPSLAKTRYALNGTSTYVDMFTADNALTQAAPADVRSGTVYADGALTGVLAVPAAASVGFGVPVDNTTGTAALTPASVWDHLLTAITTSSTIGTLLKTNIDATISSRSTATTAGIADAVWDEVLTGATHNVNRSAGKRLRQIADERIIADGQTISATTNTITLESIGTLCVGQTIVVTNQDTDEKQVRFILAFDTGTDTATVDSDWCVVPTAGDEYLLTTVRDPLVTRGDHPAGTVGAEIDEMYLIHGLKTGDTLTVTPTSRTAGAIAQTIGGDGTNTTTVSRD